MSLDKLFRAWAAERLRISVDEVLDVNWGHDAGWIGTDVTPGDPPENWATVRTTDGVKYIDCGVDLPALLAEILAVEGSKR